MSHTAGGNISISVDDSRVHMFTRAQRLSRVALKFLHAVSGKPEPVHEGHEWLALPDVAAAEAQIDEAIAWLEEIGA